MLCHLGGLLGAGFDGAQCQGPSNTITIGQGVRGFSLPPGEWAFWQLTVPPKSLTKGVRKSFVPTHPAVPALEFSLGN